MLHPPSRGRQTRRMAGKFKDDGSLKICRLYALRYPCDMEWHCPICRKPVDSAQNPDFPFCSERCRLLDLGNWANEKYKISEPVIDESTPETPGEQRDADERKN